MGLGVAGVWGVGGFGVTWATRGTRSGATGILGDRVGYRVVRGNLGNVGLFGANAGCRKGFRQSRGQKTRGNAGQRVGTRG